MLVSADLAHASPGGHYIALRIGFAFPLEEVNALPEPWVQHYTRQRFMVYDPVVRWVYRASGSVRWSELEQDDPHRVLVQAKVFGLRYGVTVCHVDSGQAAHRSFGSFVRNDREFTDEEIAGLHGYLVSRHNAKAPPKNLTAAEIEALRMVKDGRRLKQIAHDLGISEGAVKQRLKNAKLKLSANTSAQAAAMANEFGLI